MNETMRDLDALDLCIGELNCPCSLCAPIPTKEALVILATQTASYRGRLSSGAVRAFLVGARNRRKVRALKLERFLSAPLDAPLNTATATGPMLAWLNS